MSMHLSQKFLKWGALLAVPMVLSTTPLHANDSERDEFDSHEGPPLMNTPAVTAGIIAEKEAKLRLDAFRWSRDEEDISILKLNPDQSYDMRNINSEIYLQMIESNEAIARIGTEKAINKDSLESIAKANIAFLQSLLNQYQAAITPEGSFLIELEESGEIDNATAKAIILNAYQNDMHSLLFPDTISMYFTASNPVIYPDLPKLRAQIREVAPEFYDDAQTVYIIDKIGGESLEQLEQALKDLEAAPEEHEDEPELENEPNGTGIPNCSDLNTLELNDNLPCVRKVLYSMDSAGATYKLAL